MSYCRWSSDNWRCDLYCYKGANGYVIHVAARRRVGHIPAVDWKAMMSDEITTEEFGRQYRAQMDAVKQTTLEDIDLPHAGDTFEEGDLESFKHRLLYLRGVGYSFPDYVLERIDEEIAKETATENQDGEAR